MNLRRMVMGGHSLLPWIPVSIIIRMVAGLALALAVAFAPQTWRARALTNRFVSTSGNDFGGTNDCANFGQPCATIQNAVNHSSSSDVIELGPGTYFENVTVSQSATIQGDGGIGSVVNGSNKNPVFIIQDGITAALSGLTVTNGNGGTDDGGGGIRNSGTLTVTNSTITGNTGGRSGFGGGIMNDGELVLANSRVSANSGPGNAGGIYNGGVLAVADSTISGNQADFGGGILNSRTLSITRSTISGNSSLALGAGISNEGTLTITNSTISGNSSESNGGNIQNIGPLTIVSSTILGIFNGGGATMNLTNSIILGCRNIIAFIGINDHNLIQGQECGGPFSLDPKLGPLQDNGGPTFTHALLPGSPAIDAGDDSVLGSPLFLTTDQRGPGFARKAGAHVDIGAFELQLDTCLRNNSSGDLLQWSSKTGAYTFTRCSDGFTLSGTGVAKLVNGIQTLTDFKTDRRISAGFNTGQLTGNATIYLMASQGAWQTFQIVDTNPASGCKCSG